MAAWAAAWHGSLGALRALRGLGWRAEDDSGAAFEAAGRLDARRDARLDARLDACLRYALAVGPRNVALGAWRPACERRDRERALAVALGRRAAMRRAVAALERAWLRRRAAARAIARAWLAHHYAPGGRGYERCAAAWRCAANHADPDPNGALEL